MLEVALCDNARQGLLDDSFHQKFPHIRNWNSKIRSAVFRKDRGVDSNDMAVDVQYRSSAAAMGVSAS